MPNLGDFLGQLLAEVAMARMQADLETVRLAELYASHPLLKHLPVPHIRLPEAELDVPVAIQQSEVAPAGATTRGSVPLPAMRQRFDQVLGAHLERSGLTLTAQQRRQVTRALDEKVASLSGPAETAIDVRAAADALASAATEAIGRLRPGEEAAKESATLTAALSLAAQTEFLKLRLPPPRLLALVTSAELREAGGPTVTTRVRLRVNEQGVEWTTIEKDDGSAEQRLVPE